MKIGKIMKLAAVMVCAVMLLESVSAGFVWADAGEDVNDEPGSVSEVQEAGITGAEPGGDVVLQDEPENEPEENVVLTLQEEPEDDTALQDEPPEETEPLNGWVDTEAGRMYYIDDVAQTGFQEIDESRYYFNESGIMQIGMVTVDGSKYYFDENGVMQAGMLEIGGKRYYFDESGVMQKGMIKVDGAWYFFNKKGVMKTGWKTIKKKKYYFDPKTGQRQHGKTTIGKAVYYFNPKTGVMKTGWLTVNGKKYYHDKSSGKRKFGAQKIGKYYYYFLPKSGKMKIGWLKLKGKHYYYDSKGRKCFGVKTINGKTYYLHPKTGARMSKGSYYLYSPIWNKSSRTKYLVYVSKKSRYVTVYKGSIRNWTIVKRFRCSIGKPSTPTPSGTYHASSKVLHFGESKGYSVWYATGFIGTSYLIHSVVCYRGTKRVSDGRLGQAISHGCVRVSLGNAKWMYSTVPRGSTIYIK